MTQGTVPVPPMVWASIKPPVPSLAWSVRLFQASGSQPNTGAPGLYLYVLACQIIQYDLKNSTQ